MLYPLKFRPILREVVWGGDTLVKAGKKPSSGTDASRIGESWEISGLQGSVSVAANGFLKSNDLQELIEVYMGDLVGEKVYEKYGLDFPLLLKYIDARQDLSVQVHPSDQLALERHAGRGKTEMWYVVDAQPGACVWVGFAGEVTRDQYIAAVEQGTVADLLRRYEVRKGDIFYIPAGVVHVIGKGVLVAEVQQSSDITYRIDDWGRTGMDGKPRELHTDLALDALDFSSGREHLINVRSGPNTVRQAVVSPYFTVNVIRVDGSLTRGYENTDSFVAYMCVEGECRVVAEGKEESIAALETILSPAEIDEIELNGNATLLEIFIK